MHTEIIEKSLRQTVEADSFDTFTHNERSRRFVINLANNIYSIYENEEDIAVLAPGRHREIALFKRTELLYDISVFKYSTITSFKNKKKIPFVNKCIMQIESEFAKDTREIITDLNKLVCGNADIKVLIISKELENTLFFNTIKPIAQNILGELFVAFVAHPACWARHTTTYVNMYKFADSNFIHIEMN